MPPINSITSTQNFIDICRSSSAYMLVLFWKKHQLCCAEKQKYETKADEKAGVTESLLVLMENWYIS